MAKSLFPKLKIFYSDADIIKKIQQGDEKIYSYLFQNFTKPIFKFVLQNSGKEADAEDVFQEGIIILWQNIQKGKFEQNAMLSTYLFGICKNLWLKQIHRNKRKDERDIDDFHHLIGTNFNIEEQNELSKIIKLSISSLKENCIKILTLFCFENLTMNEIALETGYNNADTVKAKKSQCMKELIKIVKEKYSRDDFFN